MSYYVLLSDGYNYAHDDHPASVYLVFSSYNKARNALKRELTYCKKEFKKYEDEYHENIQFWIEKLPEVSE